jgi:hypothetical protein
MRISLRGPVLGLAAFGALAMAAPAAWAGCGAGAGVTPATWTPSTWTSDGARASDGLLTLVSNGQANPNGNGAIVGLWSVQFFAGGNMIDFGYAAWHSDGTEIMNSGGRAPSTENFCLGVWEQTGPSTYKLNHFALSYDPASGALNGRVNIKEDVVLGKSGSDFSGAFTIDVYDPNSGGLLQHVGGRIVGRRVTVD